MEPLDDPLLELLSLPNELLFNLVKFLDMWSVARLSQTCLHALELIHASDTPEIRSCLLPVLSNRTLASTVRDAKKILLPQMQRCPHAAFLFFSAREEEMDEPVDEEMLLSGFPTPTHVICTSASGLIGRSCRNVVQEDGPCVSLTLMHLPNATIGEVRNFLPPRGLEMKKGSAIFMFTSEMNESMKVFELQRLFPETVVLGGRTSGRQGFLMYSHGLSKSRVRGHSLGLVLHSPTVEIRPVVCRGLNAVAKDGEYIVEETDEDSLLTLRNSSGVVENAFYPIREFYRSDYPLMIGEHFESEEAGQSMFKVSSFVGDAGPSHGVEFYNFSGKETLVKGKKIRFYQLESDFAVKELDSKLAFLKESTGAVYGALVFNCSGRGIDLAGQEVVCATFNKYFTTPLGGLYCSGEYIPYNPPVSGEKDVVIARNYDSTFDATMVGYTTTYVCFVKRFDS